MQVEFDKSTEQLVSKYFSFPAPEITEMTADDLKTAIMSGQEYMLTDDIDITYLFTPYKKDYVKISMTCKTFTSHFIVTEDSLFDSLDDVVEFYDDNQNDQDYDDDQSTQDDYEMSEDDLDFEEESDESDQE
jgi:ABC-type phosphate/phosphonate transport system substrate-binding protein